MKSRCWHSYTPWNVLREKAWVFQLLVACVQTGPPSSHGFLPCACQVSLSFHLQGQDLRLTLTAGWSHPKTLNFIISTNKFTYTSRGFRLDIYFWSTHFSSLDPWKTRFELIAFLNYCHPPYPRVRLSKTIFYLFYYLYNYIMVSTIIYQL